MWLTYLIDPDRLFDQWRVENFLEGGNKGSKKSKVLSPCLLIRSNQFSDEVYQITKKNQQKEKL